MDKKGKDPHLLIIRLSAMGDVAMLVPVVLALTQTYPKLQITLLTRARFAPIFKDISNIAIFEADVKGEHKGVLGLYRLFRQLRQLNITAVADAHHVLRSTILNFFYLFTKIPFVQLDKGRMEKRKLTRAKNKEFRPLKPTCQRYAEVFDKLGFKIVLTGKHTLPKIGGSKKDIIFNDNNIVIGIAPFAAYQSKMYPLEKMKEVIAKLVVDPKVHVCLFGGGRKETERLQLLAAQFGASVTNVAGTVSLNEELHIISNLDVMVAMDSGNGHLAANYGIEVVTVWGVTHPYAGFAPFNQPIENSICVNRSKFPLVPTSIYGNTYPEGYEAAIASIKPATIYNRIKELLDKKAD